MFMFNHVKIRSVTNILLPFILICSAMFCLSAVHAVAAENLLGDVNVDSEVDVSDAVLHARFCAEDPDVRMNARGFANADVNRDRLVDPKDTVLILKIIARIVTQDYFDNTTVTTTATTATTTTTTTTTTVTTTTTTTTTTVTTTTTAPPVLFMVDNRTYPLGVSLSEVNFGSQPTEQLTSGYDIGNVVFSVFAKEYDKLVIAISHQDQVVGYYCLCSRYSVPNGYRATEYTDTYDNTGVYAMWLIRQDLDIRFTHLSDKSNMDVPSKLIYYVTNGLRARHGKNPYIWEDQVRVAAVSHSREMAEKDYFDHKSFDGTKFSQRLLNFGIDWKACAENIDYGYTDPFSALNGWYNSQTGHRDNLLSDTYTRIGIGFAYSTVSSKRFFGTQDFYRGWDD